MTVYNFVYRGSLQKLKFERETAWFIYISILPKLCFCIMRFNRHVIGLKIVEKACLIDFSNQYGKVFDPRFSMGNSRSNW